MQTDHFTRFRASVQETETGIITGVALPYDTDIERGFNLYERVQQGAFRSQLNAANRIMVLWQHDRDNPIGKATSLADVDGALHFSAKISQHEDIPEARKALALLREGVVEEISVGFKWEKWEEIVTEEKTTILHKKAQLMELSVVTFGAVGHDARVLTVASRGINVAAYRERLGRLQA